MTRFNRLLLMIGALVAVSVACMNAPIAPTATPYPTFTPMGGAGVVATTAPDATGGAVTVTPTPLPPSGPTNFPPNIDPLTGLPVADPNSLNKRPLLIKVSNEGPEVRPQSGWSFADHVWEYQMEGFAQTRFTAVIYGQTPQYVGSVRSARLIDIEHLVDMYGGILVFSGASSNYQHDPPGPPRVMERIRQAPWFARAMTEQLGYSDPYLVRIPDTPRPGTPYYHSLFAVPSEIWKWADQGQINQRPNLDGMAFDLIPPAGGTPTTGVVIDYPGTGPKHTWTWDEPSGKWLSATNDQPDGDFLVPNKQLGFDNVVILYIEHYQADFLEQEGDAGELYSVGLNITGDGDAVIMRNGMRFAAKWHRVNKEGMLNFTDANGATIPLKPGQTFFNCADTFYASPDIVFTPQ